MFLTRPPLPLLGARLACVRRAASVRSEPGSNSQVMILNHRDALTLFAKLFTLTRSDAPVPVKVPKHRTFIHVYVLQKNASVRIARFIMLLSQPCGLPESKRSSRRPRSPSSNHNVKELARGVNFHSARDETPLARLGPAGGVGAVYRRGVWPRQPQKSRNLPNFPAGCGQSRRPNPASFRDLPRSATRLRRGLGIDGHCA